MNRWKIKGAAEQRIWQKYAAIYRWMNKKFEGLVQEKAIKVTLSSIHISLDIEILCDLL